MHHIQGQNGASLDAIAWPTEQTARNTEQGDTYVGSMGSRFAISLYRIAAKYITGLRSGRYSPSRDPI
jgi:hypothetical protein